MGIYSSIYSLQLKNNENHDKLTRNFKKSSRIDDSTEEESSPIDDVDHFTEEEGGSSSAREARRHEAGATGEVGVAVAARVDARPSQVLQVDATHNNVFRLVLNLWKKCIYDHSFV